MIDVVSQALIEVAYDGTAEAVTRIGLGTGLPRWAVRRLRPRDKRMPPSGKQWARWQEDVVRAHLGLLNQAQVEQLRAEVPNEHVLDNLGCLTLEQIGQRIGRSADAVKIRIHRNGWRSFLRNPQWLTARDVGLAMGVDSHAVTKWIERGYLEADTFPYEGRMVHRVRREELRRFVTDPENWAYYEVEKIADQDLREAALSVRDGKEYVTTAQVARRLGCTVNWIATLINRGIIPAKRWGNFYIHRDDAAKVKVPGPGGRYDGKTAFSAEEDRWILRARSVGLSYTDTAARLHRHLSAVAQHCQVLNRRRSGEVPQDEAVVIAGKRLLGSWKVLAKREKGQEFRELAGAVGRFRAGRMLSKREVSLISGLLHAWVEFFIDGRQLRKERRYLKYRQWRTQDPLLAIYMRLLSWGLDPCRERWTGDWQKVIEGGARNLGDEAQGEWREWVN